MTALHSGEGAEKPDHAYVTDEKVKMIKPFGKLGEFLIKLNMQFPYNLAIILLGIRPTDIKTYVHKNSIQEYL